MNIKIEQELNFVVDDSRLFLDAQEAKKGERTYSSLIIYESRLYLGREFKLPLIAMGSVYGGCAD